MIKSVNSCLNCENLVESLKCVKHNLSVQIDNVCEDHSIKKACLLYTSDAADDP